MVVFGDSTNDVYMSHIPMFHKPHDVQAIFKVKIPEGGSFNDGLYTFEPKRYSLDDMLLGNLKRIEGTLYRGSFEDGGVPIGQTSVELEQVLSASELRNDTSPLNVLTYQVVGSPRQAYLVHAISAPPDFDQIVQLDTTRTRLRPEDCGGQVQVTVPGRPNTVEERLKPGTVDALLGGRTVQLSVARVLSTLVGPDFTKAPQS
jgi:hypothetical protein